VASQPHFFEESQQVIIEMNFWSKYYIMIAYMQETVIMTFEKVSNSSYYSIVLFSSTAVTLCLEFYNRKKK
jgi:hypothetical protein